MQKKNHPKEPTNGIIVVQKNHANPYRARVATGTYKDSKGKSQTKYVTVGTYRTKKEAQKALLLYEQNPYDLTSKVGTFEELYRAWSEDYFKTLSTPSSIRTVECAYRYCSGLYKMNLRDIGSGHIKDAMTKGFIIASSGKDKGKKRYASKSTQERIKSMCNLMFDYAMERNLVVTNPARKFQIGKLLKDIEQEAKKKKPFTAEEIELMWKYEKEVPFMDMILIGIYTGFRPQELTLLEVEDVDLKKHCIVGGMKTIAGTDRSVPIHPRIQPLVEFRYKQAIERFNSPMLFNKAKGRTGTRITYDMYRGAFENAMMEMGFNGYTPHCTRHTFSTFAMRSHLDPGIRKRILGHSLKGDVTESVYVHPTFKDLYNEMLKFDIKSVDEEE